MLARSVAIALLASAVTLVKGQYSGDGMSILPFLGMHLMLFIVTYYTPGVGACGRTNTNADYIVAVAAATFDSYPYVLNLGRSLVARGLTAVLFIVALHPTQTSRLI
jgi:hypothetical protein